MEMMELRSSRRLMRAGVRSCDVRASLLSPRWGLAFVFLRCQGLTTLAIDFRRVAAGELP